MPRCASPLPTSAPTRRACWLPTSVRTARSRRSERVLEITRLGEGVDGSGTLAAAPMLRVTDTLERFAERSHGLAAERLLAVATSAVRDAVNRDEFLAR